MFEVTWLTHSVLRREHAPLHSKDDDLRHVTEKLCTWTIGALQTQVRNDKNDALGYVREELCSGEITALLKRAHTFSHRKTNVGVT